MIISLNDQLGLCTTDKRKKKKERKKERKKGKKAPSGSEDSGQTHK